MPKLQPIYTTTQQQPPTKMATNSQHIPRNKLNYINPDPQHPSTPKHCPRYDTPRLQTTCKKSLPTTKNTTKHDHTNHGIRHTKRTQTQNNHTSPYHTPIHTKNQPNEPTPTPTKNTHTFTRPHTRISHPQTGNRNQHQHLEGTTHNTNNPPQQLNRLITNHTTYQTSSQHQNNRQDHNQFNTTNSPTPKHLGQTH